MTPRSTRNYCLYLIKINFYVYDINVEPFEFESLRYEITLVIKCFTAQYGTLGSNLFGYGVSFIRVYFTLNVKFSNVNENLIELQSPIYALNRKLKQQNIFFNFFVRLLHHILNYR